MVIMEKKATINPRIIFFDGPESDFSATTCSPSSATAALVVVVVVVEVVVVPTATTSHGYTPAEEFM
jgi:membrane protein YdbS with pleckstrin-like domain